MNIAIERMLMATTSRGIRHAQRVQNTIIFVLSEQ